MKKISNVEWGMLIGFMALIDIGQLLVDLIPVADIFFAGFNEVLDVGIAFALAMYFALRSGNFDWKKIATQAVGFLGKEGTAGGAPLWTLEVGAMFGWQKLDEKLATLGVMGDIASKLIHEKMGGESGDNGNTASTAPSHLIPFEQNIGNESSAATHRNNLNGIADRPNSVDLRDQREAA